MYWSACAYFTTRMSINQNRQEEIKKKKPWNKLYLKWSTAFVCPIFMHDETSIATPFARLASSVGLEPKGVSVNTAYNQLTGGKSPEGTMST